MKGELPKYMDTEEEAAKTSEGGSDNREENQEEEKEGRVPKNLENSDKKTE